MTFISSIVTKQGILLAADSLELTQGGALLWDDFAEILKEKGKSEDDTIECISPIEIKEIFNNAAQRTKGRIRSIEGAQKIFKINNFCAIQVAGKVSINKKEIPEIIEDLSIAIEKVKSDEVEKWIETAFNLIKANLDADGSEISECAYIFSCYDPKTTDFKSCKFFFDHDIIRDEKGIPIGQEQGKWQSGFVLKSTPLNWWFNIAGQTTYFTEMNNLNRDFQKDNINLEQAFDLTEKLFALVISIEKTINCISGIGGPIKYAVITSDGFKNISSRTDIIN